MHIDHRNTMSCVVYNILWSGRRRFLRVQHRAPVHPFRSLIKKMAANSVATRRRHLLGSICLSSISRHSPVPCPYPTCFSFPTSPTSLLQSVLFEDHLFTFQWLSLLNHLATIIYHNTVLVPHSLQCHTSCNEYT